MKAAANNVNKNLSAATLWLFSQKKLSEECMVDTTNCCDNYSHQWWHTYINCIKYSAYDKDWKLSGYLKEIFYDMAEQMLILTRKCLVTGHYHKHRKYIVHIHITILTNFIIFACKYCIVKNFGGKKFGE